MKKLFNPDFRDFLAALHGCAVEHILVGGYAVVLHGYPRMTGDMDVWVKKTAANYHRLAAAFRLFGMPVFDMTERAFLENPDLDVFSFGTPPVSIDLLTAVKGLDFESSFEKAELRTEGDLIVRLLSKADLLRAKAAAGRAKDLDDIEHLRD